MTASVTHGRALRYAGGSARGLLHHVLGHCHLRKKQPSLEVVFVTGTQDPEKVRRMEAILPSRILRKPIQEDELRDALADALS